MSLLVSAQPDTHTHDHTAQQPLAQLLYTTLALEQHYLRHMEGVVPPPTTHNNSAMNVEEVSNNNNNTITTSATHFAPPASVSAGSIEEVRRQLEENRKAFEKEKRAFEQEKDQIEKDRRKLKKLIAFKQQVTLELAGFWKEKGIRQGGAEHNKAANVAGDGNAQEGDKKDATAQDNNNHESETMTVNRMRDVLHKLLQREQELSETSLLLRARAKGADGKMMDDMEEDDDEDDGDDYEDEEEEDDDDEGVLVLEEAVASSDGEKGKGKKEKKKRKKKKAKKKSLPSNGGIANNGEGAEAVGSLLDAASHQEKMEQLKAFKDQFGHCKVPWAWKDNPQLGRWVSRMRSLQRNGKLDESTRSELEAMGKKPVIPHSFFVD